MDVNHQKKELVSLKIGQQIMQSEEQRDEEWREVNEPSEKCGIPLTAPAYVGIPEGEERKKQKNIWKLSVWNPPNVLKNNNLHILKTQKFQVG